MKPRWSKFNNHSQYRRESFKLQDFKQLYPLFFCGYKDIKFAAFLVSQVEIFKRYFDTLECMMIKYDITNHPIFQHHPNVNFLKQFLFLDEEGVHLAGTRICSIELKENISFNQIEDILQLYYPYLHDRISIYKTNNPSNWYIADIYENEEIRISQADQYFDS